MTNTIKQNLLNLIVFIIIFFTAINKIPRLIPFEDELIALTSHLNFLTDFRFDSPFESGVGVSSRITTGFNASIGGAFAWLFTKSFFYTRLFNFIWFLLVANLLKLYLYKKNFFKDVKTILAINLSYLVIPWWYGALYGLGEMISTVIFFFAIIIFNYDKKLSFLLISISVFYGKFILIISAGIFLIFNLKDAIKNYAYLVFPQIIWYLIIIYNKGLNGFREYFIDFYYFASFHGLLNNSQRKNQNIIGDLLNSEVMNWPVSIKIRVILLPILLSIYLLISKNYKTSVLNKIIVVQLPLIIIINYLYFFLLSYKKYLRYSQVTLIITILLLLILIDNNNHEGSKNKPIFLFNFLFSLFFSDILLIVIFNISIFFIVFKNKFSTINFLLLFLILNTVNINYEILNDTLYNLNHPPCVDNIQSFECGDSFFTNKF